MECQRVAVAINDINSTIEGTTKTKPNILTIPPEIRLLIYEAYFAIFKFDKSKPQPAIIFACKLMHEEALGPYEARLTAIREDRSNKFQEASAALQQRIDTCRVYMKALDLHMEQMTLELDGHAAIMDVQFELGKVHSMKYGIWFKQPRRKVSVSYMKGVIIPQPY